MGRFDDRATRPRRGVLDFLRWQVGKRVFGPGPAKNAARFETPRRAHDARLLASPAASLTWIGHASFLARLGGRLFAIDPVWSTRLVGGLGPRRLVPPGVPIGEVPPLDLVLVTHDHFDHMDAPTLRRLGRGAVAVTPLGNGRFLRGEGFERIVELDWWERHEHGGLEVTLVPARHWSVRRPWDRNDALWGGFVVRGPEGVLYHAGDTAFFDGFSEIGRRLGPIDWALLPIGAYAPRWFMEPQHMDPEEAIAAFEQLRARHLVPMHWGTFALGDEPPGEPPAIVRRLWADKRWNPEGLWLLDVGETRPLRA